MSLPEEVNKNGLMIYPPGTDIAAGIMGGACRKPKASVFVARHGDEEWADIMECLKSSHFNWANNS